MHSGFRRPRARDTSALREPLPGGYPIRVPGGTGFWPLRFRVTQRDSRILEPLDGPPHEFRAEHEDDLIDSLHVPARPLARAPGEVRVGCSARAGPLALAFRPSTVGCRPRFASSAFGWQKTVRLPGARLNPSLLRLAPDQRSALSASRSSTILPVTPPFSSSSWARLASVSGNR